MSRKKKSQKMCKYFQPNPYFTSDDFAPVGFCWRLREEFSFDKCPCRCNHFVPGYLIPTEISTGELPATSTPLDLYARIIRDLKKKGVVELGNSEFWQRFLERVERGRQKPPTFERPKLVKNEIDQFLAILADSLPQCGQPPVLHKETILAYLRRVYFVLPPRGKRKDQETKSVIRRAMEGLLKIKSPELRIESVFQRIDAIGAGRGNQADGQ